MGPNASRARILLTWTKVDAAVYQYVAVWNFMAFALRAEGLWKLYESGESVIQAVQDVSLSIKQGSMVAIMGPSGCGKTTLLNVLSGIDEPNSGTVMINGENLYGSSDDERTRVRGKHMGFIFQEFNLLPVMTALKTLSCHCSFKEPLRMRLERGNKRSLLSVLVTASNIDLLNYQEVNSSRLRLLEPLFTGLQLCSVMSQLEIWMQKLRIHHSTAPYAVPSRKYDLPHCHTRRINCSAM